MTAARLKRDLWTLRASLAECSLIPSQLRINGPNIGREAARFANPSAFPESLAGRGRVDRGS